MFVQPPRQVDQQRYNTDRALQKIKLENSDLSRVPFFSHTAKMDHEIRTAVPTKPWAWLLTRQAGVARKLSDTSRASILRCDSQTAHVSRRSFPGLFPQCSVDVAVPHPLAGWLNHHAKPPEISWILRTVHSWWLDLVLRGSLTYKTHCLLCRASKLRSSHCVSGHNKHERRCWVQSTWKWLHRSTTGRGY